MLLIKHPDRVHEQALTFGKGLVFCPEAIVTLCEAGLTIDVDPICRVPGGRGEGEDRPACE